MSSTPLGSQTPRPQPDGAPMLQSSLQSLPLVYRGKVRDTYAVGSDRLLIVTTDRLSAFDVVLNEPIPGKGYVLNALSNFWFGRLAHVVPNHLTGVAPESVVASNETGQVAGRSVVAMRLTPLPIEAVVRGYLIGSGWSDYQASGQVCGIELPAGMPMAARLPEPIFTPAIKAELGRHDENISFEQVCDVVGAAVAQKIRSTALTLYREASSHAQRCGILIADTKFEFGLDTTGEMRLMDEVLTPDSSRFWPLDRYRTGESPPSFDKQFVRDWLQAQPWNKAPPPPALPPEIVERTAAKYREALERLTDTISASSLPGPALGAGA
jgi:phosphoribosylaminoimidazole-succinocarboxamide synthase